MSKYIFEGGFRNTSGIVKVMLILFHFEDENNIHFVYVYFNQTKN